MLFLKVLFTEFVAEMGDKTQLMLVAMTSKYKTKDIVIGTAAAILVLNGLAVLLGGLVSNLIPPYIVKLVAGAAFLFFAVTSLKIEDDEEEEAKEKKIKVAAIAVFCTFFVAELGDKTQLTAIAFGANEGLGKAVIVWLACSIGLFLADMLGMVAGLLLKNKLPKEFLNLLAYIIFAVFGMITVHTGFTLLVEATKISDITVIATIIVGCVFALLSGIFLYRMVKRWKSLNKEN
ncbi:MAG: TMEM165/GDT1 family protein [Lachnospiraceae bacterium]|nr:TMEM165/GDT1 family protein [Lachnospiraceae bacterium]